MVTTLQLLFRSPLLGFEYTKRILNTTGQASSNMKSNASPSSAQHEVQAPRPKAQQTDSYEQPEMSKSVLPNTSISSKLYGSTT